MRLLNVLLVLALAWILAPVGLMAQQFGQKQSAAPKTDKIAAVVNGEKISESEVARTLQRQLRGRELPPERSQEIREMMLQMIIDGRLVKQFLAGKKIQADPKAIDATIDGLKKQVVGSGLPFEDALKRQGLTEVTLRQLIADELSFQKYSDTVLTDRDVQEYFKTHQAELGGTEVRASHILVKVPENAADADRQAALAKIKGIRQEITKGLDFAEAAKKYSSCPSKEQGGDLGFFPRHNRMVEPFAAAAFGLAKGGLSEPVETQFGWHLIKVTDRREKGLNDVRDQIKSALASELWKKTADEQRKVAKIEIPK